MSFVITQPEALAAAAGNLQGIGAAIAAQNAAAAAPTTGVVPAAADEVSVLQATQFASYGNLYQQVSAQAAAVHEMFAHTLGASADSYGATEAANTVAAGSSGSGLLGFLTGNGSYGLVPSALSNGAVAGAMQIGNFGSGASDLLQLGSAGFLAPGALTGVEASGAGAGAPGSFGAAVLTGAVEPAGPASVGGAPVSAVVGQAFSVGRLSVPPSWAGQVAASSTAVPATLAGAGWTTAASNSMPVATMPAGMPSVASAGRGGYGFGGFGSFGVPRYGVKPIVMPKSAVV